MEEVSQVRRAAREAVADVAPAPFGETVERALADGSVAPGVLVVLCARATDREADFEGLADRAAGTQLIYDGLRLTRDLAHDPPWELDADGTRDADVAVLVADVLVARGFYLLARTDAAERAVETVRAFGRHETRRRTDADAREESLEADVFDLAAVAGTTAVGESPPSALRRFVTERAAEIEDDLPPAAALFGSGTIERLGSLAAPVADGGSTDGNRNG